MKNYLSLLSLSFVLIFSAFGALDSVVASGDSKKLIKEGKLDAKLVELGYPDELLSIMDYNQKFDIVSSKPVKFSGYEKTDFIFNENGDLEELPTPGEDGISVMATIPTADLSLYNSRNTLGTFNGRDTYCIYANWNWKIDPFFTYKDKIGFSYSDNFQTRASNNGGYYCQNDALIGSLSKLLERNTCSGRLSEISLGGAAWGFDIYGGATVRNKGYAQMDIETKDNTSPTGTAITLSKYYHKKGVSGSLGVSIGYVSISINSGSNYDEAAVQSSWYY